MARSRHWRLNPHTVIASDLGEMQDALEPAGGEQVDGGEQVPVGLAGFSSVQPNIARMYDYCLVGKDHYAADRAVADSLSARFP